MDGIAKASADVFGEYAASKAGDIPEHCPWQKLQVELAAWQARNFGGATDEQMALGVAEEAGELCHSVLKHSQKIRGLADKQAYRAALGDALADIAIYAMQLATANRLDFETLVHETARKVMKREWKANPENGE